MQSPIATPDGFHSTFRAFRATPSGAPRLDLLSHVASCSILRPFCISSIQFHFRSCPCSTIRYYVLEPLHHQVSIHLFKYTCRCCYGSRVRISNWANSPPFCLSQSPLSFVQPARQDRYSVDPSAKLSGKAISSPELRVLTGGKKVFLDDAKNYNIVD